MLRSDEQETTISQMGDDHTRWEVFTDDPVWIKRLDKIAVAVESIGLGKHYMLDANQIIVRAKPKPMSDERKAQYADRLRLTRQAPTLLGAKQAEVAL